MTLSRDSRDQNLNDALMRMTEDVGEGPLSGVDFEAHSGRYQDIHSTTWDLLMDRGHVKYRWVETYNLTVAGWTAGVLLLGRHKEPPFATTLSDLMAKLKDQIKGRSDYEAYLSVTDAAALTGISEVLIRNIVEGCLIERAFNLVGATLDADDVILIPRRFGYLL